MVVKVVKQLSKSCLKVVQHLSRSGQKVVPRFCSENKVVKKCLKSCHQVEKLLPKLSRWFKSCLKVVKKWSRGRFSWKPQSGQKVVGKLTKSGPRMFFLKTKWSKSYQKVVLRVLTKNKVVKQLSKAGQKVVPDQGAKTLGPVFDHFDRRI